MATAMVMTHWGCGRTNRKDNSLASSKRELIAKNNERGTYSKSFALFISS